MADCPHCKKAIVIPECAYGNADAYGMPCVVATLCCGKGVRLTPIRSYRFEPYEGGQTEDDWGVRFQS